MDDPGVIVLTGLLLQRTALSIGGTEEDGLLDDAFCRDGRGRPTLRGTSLTGALLDSIRKSGFGDLPPTVTGDARLKRNDRFHGESVLRVWTTHPEHCWHRHDVDYLPEFLPRAGVGIRQDTGAAKDGALYDLEVLPAGERWPLIVELDLWRYQQLHSGRAHWSAAQLLAAIEAGLEEWRRQRCWIGRGVARGLGWMELLEFKPVQLSNAVALSWTNQTLFGQTGRREFVEVVREIGKLPVVATPIAADPTKCSEADRWVYRRLTGHIRVGERDKGWGLDSLSIGGHQAGWGDPGPSHLVKPSELSTRKPFPDKPTDMSLAMTPVKDAQGATQWVPLVPGSGIRGSLRHELSRTRRKRGERVRDPLTGKDYVQQPQATLVAAAAAASPQGGMGVAAGATGGAYALDVLFGAMPAKSGAQRAGIAVPNSSRLLVSDAHLDGDGWHYGVMQMHAEDEFTAGVFASGKFDRLAVMQGNFAFEMVIEAPPDEAVAADAAIAEITELLSGADGHGLPLGGSQWRGHGWVHWDSATREKAMAGEDWQPAAPVAHAGHRSVEPAVEEQST